MKLREQRRPTRWRGADGYGRWRTAWLCLRDHCKADEEWGREGWFLADVLPANRYTTLRDEGGWAWSWRQPWRAWAWLHRQLWVAAYTGKALLCVLLLPERWPSYSDYPDTVLVTTGHGYTPDWEYTWGGSWHEVQIGHGWRPRTWWWHWAWESSV